MVHVCCMPNCTSRSDREVNLSYYGLSLLNKRLLKQWVHKIGCSNLPLNQNTKVCSCHFVNAKGRKLRKNEAPSENLPVLSISETPTVRRKPPREQRPPPQPHHRDLDCEKVILDEDKVSEEPGSTEKAVNTDLKAMDLEELKKKIAMLENQVETLTKECNGILANVSHNDKMVIFYTGFLSFASLKACFKFLTPIPLVP